MPAALLGALLCALAACNRFGPPDSNPVDLTCGFGAVACAASMCCPEGTDCGGGKVTWCPAGMCCANGGDEGARRPTPQTAATRKR